MKHSLQSDTSWRLLLPLCLMYMSNSICAMLGIKIIQILPYDHNYHTGSSRKSNTVWTVVCVWWIYKLHNDLLVNLARFSETMLWIKYCCLRSFEWASLMELQSSWGSGSREDRLNRWTCVGGTTPFTPSPQSSIIVLWAPLSTRGQWHSWSHEWVFWFFFYY